MTPAGGQEISWKSLQLCGVKINRFFPDLSPSATPATPMELQKRAEREDIALTMDGGGKTPTNAATKSFVRRGAEGVSNELRPLIKLFGMFTLFTTCICIGMSVYGEFPRRISRPARPPRPARAPQCFHLCLVLFSPAYYLLLRYLLPHRTYFPSTTVPSTPLRRSTSAHLPPPRLLTTTTPPIPTPPTPQSSTTRSSASA